MNNYWGQNKWCIGSQAIKFQNIMRLLLLNLRTEIIQIFIFELFPFSILH